jgi:hypothetical protein
MPGIDGAMLREWRRSRGWDVPEMAQRLRRAAREAGVPVATLTGLVRMIYAWERGDHGLSERYELLYRRALGLAVGYPCDPDVPQDLAQDEDEIVRRHDFLVLAGAATASMLTGPFTRTRPEPHPAAPVDEASVSALTVITGAQRRLEATTPARDLAKSVMAHTDTARHMLIRAGQSPHSVGIAAALSEACGLAAWLHADMTDTGTARACYRQAIQAAGLARSDLLAGYMRGSLAAFEADVGVPALGLPLIEQAWQQIGKLGRSTPVAWLLAVQALTLAGAGEGGDAAWRALGHAEQVLARGDNAEAPP